MAMSEIRGRGQESTNPRIAELEAVIERDRSLLAERVKTLQKVISLRDWLGEGRGPFDWDDDRWHDEFNGAATEIREAVEPLIQLAADLSNSPTKWEDIQKARQSSGSIRKALVEALEIAAEDGTTMKTTRLAVEAALKMERESR